MYVVHFLQCVVSGVDAVKVLKMGVVATAQQHQEQDDDGGLSTC